MSVTIYKFLKKKESKVFPFQHFRIAPVELFEDGKMVKGKVTTVEARMWELCSGGGVVQRNGNTIRSLKKNAEILFAHIQNSSSDKESTSTFKKNVFLKMKRKYRELYGLEEGETDELPELALDDSDDSDSDEDYDL